MSPEVWLLLLRIALAVLLYAFLGSLFVLIVRDLRTAVDAEPTRRRPYGRLVVISGDSPQPGAEFPLLSITSIGRAPTNTVPLSDTFASTEHSLLTYRAGQWWLEDLGSRNGTSVNGIRITTPTVVSSGDVIGVGRVQLKLVLE